MCRALIEELKCTIWAWACRCQVTLHDVNPYLVALWVFDQDLYHLHCLRFLVTTIILSGVSVSHGCCFVCLWLDHYLHQHGKCGPRGATWLGGVTTFTTARDRCTETIFVLVRLLLDVFTWYFKFQSMLSCDLCFHWNAWTLCLDDVSLNTFHIMMISMW